MINIIKNKYKLISFALLAIYGCLLISSIICGKFDKIFRNNNTFPIGDFLFIIFFILLVVSLLCLTAFIFYKLKLFIPYVVFSVIMALLMVVLPHGGGASVGSISFPWYEWFEAVISVVIIFLVPILLAISLLIRLIGKILGKHSV